MANDILMQLGDIQFGIDTAAYNSLLRKIEHRWAAQPRLGRTPALQYIGPGSFTITLNGVVYPSQHGSEDAIRDHFDTDSLDEQEPMLLVDGRGNVHDFWVIKKVEETQSHHLDNGAPRKLKFMMQLQFYGEDIL